MISGFLTSVISFPPTTPAYRGTPYVDYWFLPSSTPAFCSEAFDKQTNRVGTDVADKHARYISRVLLSPAKSRRSRMNGDNGAHRCVDYCFCKRTAIISAAKVRHYKRKDCPDALFLCRENGGQRVMFSGIFMSPPPIGILLYLIRNKVDCW